MARNQKDQMFDLSHYMKDAGLIAASAAWQVGGAAKIIDLGLARVDGRVIVDVSAIETDTGNELYTLLVQGSTSATFASGIFNLGSVLLGDSSTSLETIDSVAGRREIHFCNEVNGVLYRYLRGYTIVAGTIATGINFTAFAVPEYF